MTQPSNQEVQERKKTLRAQAHATRNAQENKEQLSQKILNCVVALPEYQQARSVLYYLDVRSEVRTRHHLPTALAQGKKIAVPYCVADTQLQLFKLQCMTELEPGMYNILEPRKALRPLDQKQVDVQELDVILVPGLAFDYKGARLGYGKGYYDRLLEQARPDVTLIGLAFECQLLPEIPVAEHDILMDQIITEKAAYEGRRSIHSRLPRTP